MMKITDSQKSYLLSQRRFNRDLLPESTEPAQQVSAIDAVLAEESSLEMQISIERARIKSILELEARLKRVRAAKEILLDYSDTPEVEVAPEVEVVPEVVATKSRAPRKAKKAPAIVHEDDFAV